jgi:hypothetical protein
MTAKRNKHLHASGVATAILAGAAVLWTVPAVAVDGEILITQSKVNAGSVSPGDSAGFPATLSRPGRYKLGGNLVAPNAINAVEITANDVTLDLNGFTISNAAPGSDARGIYAYDGANRMRALNGTVTGFANYGVLSLGTQAVVENMRIVGNGIGMQLDLHSRVRNSTIANNTSVGMYCYGCLIEDSIVTGNAFAGILDSQGGGGMVLGNIIVGNGDYGLVAPAPPAPKTGYAANILIGNHSGGLQVLNVNQAHPNECDPACP